MTVKTIVMIALYVAAVWFITRFIAFCTKDEMEE